QLIYDCWMTYRNLHRRVTAVAKTYEMRLFNFQEFEQSDNIFGVLRKRFLFVAITCVSVRLQLNCDYPETTREEWQCPSKSCLYRRASSMDQNNRFSLTMNFVIHP